MSSINIVAKYDMETFKDFFYITLFKKNIKLRKYICFSVIVILFIISLIMFIEDKDELFELIFMCVVLVCYLYALYAIPVLQFKRVSKDVTFTEPQTYCFNEDEFEVTQETNESSGITRRKYSTLYKVYETNIGFYLFITKVQAFLIPKKCLSELQSEELSGFFETVIEKEKYMKMK